MKVCAFRSFVWSVVMLFATLALQGQSTKGTIEGVVQDTTGAVLPNASVTVARNDGGESRTTTTTSAGQYRIEALIPGTYSVTVTTGDFAPTKIANVEVRTSTITPVNVQLTVKKTSETVTVEASASQIQTETGELSNTIPIEQVKDLPIPSGNPYALAVTLPGVNTTLSSRDKNTNGPEFSVNGLRPRANNFLIDGFDNNDNGIQGQALQPTNQEAVQEVTVKTDAYEAEYGRGGASVSNLSFRSGTNQFKGALWEQYSGSKLNAVTAEEHRAGLTRPSQFVNNLFGFRLGGPVYKDQLFFFGTSQWNRFYGAGQGNELNIPTEAGVAALQSIGTNANAKILIDSLGGLRGNPGTLPAVNIGDRAGCGAPCLIDMGTFTRFPTEASPSYEWTARVDYQPTTSDNIYGRYTGTHSSLTPDLFANPSTLPTQDTQQGGPARNLGIMWAHTFSPRVINEFRFSSQTINFTFGPTAATLADPLAHLPQFIVPSLGNATPGGFSQGTWPQGRGHDVFQFQDSISMIHGAHTFKMGVDLALIEVHDVIPFNSDGIINYFRGGTCQSAGVDSTCSDLANYLDDFTGPSGAVNKQFGNARINFRTTQQAYYFQGSWKARPNVTLTYGVRYEYQPPDASNVLPFPAVNRRTALTDPLNLRVEQKPDRNNFQPRIGLAYSPHFWNGLFGAHKTVIRAGWGMFNDTFFTNISDNTASSFPNTLGGNLIGAPGTRGLPNATALLNSIAAVPDPTNFVSSVLSDLRNPLAHQWNLNVQRELPGKLIAEVAYVGTRGEHLFVNEELNPGLSLNTARGNISPRTNRGDSTYHGLQTQVSRNYHGLSLRGAYTWSHSIDNQSEVFATSGGSSRWKILDDPRSDRGPSSFQRTHRAVVAWVYDIPSPKEGAGFMRPLSYILRNWETSGTVSFETGAPQNVYVGFDANGDSYGGNDRPSLGNPKVPINYNPTCLDPAGTCNTGVGFSLDGVTFVDFNSSFGFDPSTGNFTATAQDFHYNVVLGQNGNLGRNTLYNPGRQDWNLSVLRRIPLFHEGKHQLEFRVDLFNAFNHPNFGVANGGIEGRLTSASFLNKARTLSGGRNMVLWMKYSF